LFAWCACHLGQRALGDAILASSALAFAATAIDKGAEILRSKPVALELGFVVPVSVAPRWAAKQGTINFLQRHPDIPQRICGAVMQGRLGASTVLDSGEGDGGRPVRELLTPKCLECLRELLSGADLVYMILAGPYLEATRIMEGNTTSCGEVLWLWERAYEASYAWRDKFRARGFLVPDGDIEAVRGVFVARFYRGRCRGTYLLSSFLTFTGCILLLERSGRAAPRPNPRNSAVDTFNVCETTARTVEIALERLLADPPVPMAPELARRAASAQAAAFEERCRATELEWLVHHDAPEEMREAAAARHAVAAQAACDRQNEFELAQAEAVAGLTRASRRRRRCPGRFSALTRCSTARRTRLRSS
jgi:hypothetical protein